MSTEESNKLIAEFMGYTIMYRNGHDPIIEYAHGEWASISIWSQFHSSWDWLMPVIEKIDALACVKEVVIRPRRTRIWLKSSFIQSHWTPGTSNMVQTYCTIIDFIQWYNQQPPTNEQYTRTLYDFI